MEKKDRRNCFIMNTIALFLIVVIVYFNYELLTYSFKQLKPASNGIYYGRLPLYPQFAYFISAFLCSLLLQNEEILTIIRRRKSLLIRWEMILLGIIALLLALIGFWVGLSHKPSLFGESNYGIFTVLVNGIFAAPVHAIILSRLWEVACMFAAGVFFVRAFHVQDRIINKNQRIIWFTWSVLLIFFIVVIVYLNRELKWLVMEKSYIAKSLGSTSYPDHYVLYFANIISTFVCSLLVLGENISTIIRQRKALFIRWELFILGLVAIMLALMKIWFVLIYINIIFPLGFDIGFPTEINKIITLNDFWDNALIFAAGMLFVRAFHIKIDKINFKDSEIKENK